MWQKIKKLRKTAGAEQPLNTQTGDENLSPQVLKRQALLEHFIALRKTVIVSLVSIVLAFAAVFFGFSKQLVTFLMIPINARGIDLIYISLYETFVVELKLSFIAGTILVSPVVFWQIWSFIKPALYPHEKRAVIRMVSITVFLFLLGALFGYLIVFQTAVNFFLAYNEGLAAPFISIEKYAGFLTSFLLPFGLAFQLPVIMLLLTRNRVLDIATFRRCRKFIIFGIVVISALLTPPDGISMLMLAAPLILLFELGLLVSRLGIKRAEKQEAEEGSTNKPAPAS
jgi:sec-independent protein translocase protein TatC